MGVKTLSEVPSEQMLREYHSYALEWELPNGNSIYKDFDQDGDYFIVHYGPQERGFRDVSHKYRAFEDAFDYAEHARGG